MPGRWGCRQWEERRLSLRRLIGTLFWVALLAFMFAHVEIEIEGAAGWAASLPTWRIEHHWLLDLFWGGRAMTGYHAWVFSFMFLFFHFPMVASSSYAWRSEVHALGCIMLFWIVEDFLWFVLNPAYGLARFDPVHVLWHKRWMLHAPIEYWLFLPVAVVLLFKGTQIGDTHRRLAREK